MKIDKLIARRRFLDIFMWQCPLCQLPINVNEKAIQCANKHTFDKAKAGYVNLLPVQFKKSKSPGDDKEMVRARRMFHEQKGYQPLKDTMCEILARYFASQSLENTPLTLYDAGCGEGSYLHACVKGLKESGFILDGAGSDISKTAVELAAKAYKSCQFVVASSFDLPLQNSTLDAAIQVFAPGSTKEYARILKPHGVLLTVDPAPRHLFELKSLVYSNPQPHKDEPTERDGFNQIKHENLSYTLSLPSPEQRLALVKMTPYYWRLTPEKLDKVVENLASVTVDFNIQVFSLSSS